MRGEWVVGITGASGAIYGTTLCRFLLEQQYRVHLLITDAGWRVLADEAGWDAARRKDTIATQFGAWADKLVWHPISDIGASIASGSYPVDGMAIVPCSMGTLAKIAAGFSGNLLERTADVMLKEGRRLVIVPRETPLSAIHLDNMLKLARLGVRVVPAMPAFYHQPVAIADLISFQVGKVLDSMGIDNQLYSRWGANDGNNAR